MKADWRGAPAEQRRAQQDWQSARNRPKCGNCKHVEVKREDRMPPWDKATWRCTLGDFATTANAICDSHVSMRRSK